MKTQNIVIAAIAIAGGLSLSVAVERPAIAERPVAMADIDFTALQRQADAALEHLRQAQLRHQMPARAADGLYF